LLLFEARQHDGGEQLDGDNAGTEFAVWHFTRRAVWHFTRHFTRRATVNKPIKYILQIFLLVSVLKRDFVVPIITSANSENLKWQLRILIKFCKSYKNSDIVELS